MGSSQEDQPLHPPSQLGQDTGGLGAGPGDGSPPARPEPLTPHLPTDLLDAADAARPRAALLERHLLEGERELHGSGQGPYFYIGGTNGASM